MKDSFLGYRRNVGRAGIRNKVLLLPVDRYSNQVAWNIDRTVAGLTRFNCPGDLGRHESDRERLYRVMVGFIRNPNVSSVLLISVKSDFNYPETRASRILDAIKDCGKPVEELMIKDEGGMGQATLIGQNIARHLVRQAGLLTREEVPLSDLTIGIKCGISDGTSGISGNPALGSAMDVLVDLKGTVMFSETTEIIGAEHLLAERAVDAQTRERLFQMVARTEAQAKAVGEDIRSINPIPSNIKAGISTLEEKSLGAIAKGGTTPLQGALEYAQQPDGNGLYFMDGWMAGNSLLPGLAAAGAQLTVFQSGGGDMPDDPPIPAVNPALISPVFFMTGNPHLASKLKIGLDFDSSRVLTENLGLDHIGAEILNAIRQTASGQLTWGETLQYTENQEIWFDGPFF